MTRRYICDNCGKEFEDETQVSRIEFRSYQDGQLYNNSVADNNEGEPEDYCDECITKIKMKIKEGIN